MLTKQFLLSTQRPNHPNRTDLNAPNPDCQMKKTLRSVYGEEIKGMSQPDIPDDQYKIKVKEIHTKAVRSVISKQKNKVLNTRPPEINTTERSLPRQTRTTLAQLHSGYSNYRNSYKSRIDPEIQDKCPYCEESHTTTHLFNCTNHPTTLTVTDLWNSPIDAARFLDLPLDDNDHG